MQCFSAKLSYCSLYLQLFSALFRLDDDFLSLYSFMMVLQAAACATSSRNSPKPRRNARPDRQDAWGVFGGKGRGGCGVNVFFVVLRVEKNKKNDKAGFIHRRTLLYRV